MSQPVEKVSRSEKSLSTLTKKFLEMLQFEKTLDLNIATMALDVSKKRRIYDITNVMEGCNLIKKTGKNMYSWCGRTSHIDDSEEQFLLDLKEDKEKLSETEKKLDNDIKVMKMNLASLQSKSSKSFCYLTKDDFIAGYGGAQTVFVVQNSKVLNFILGNEQKDVHSIHLSNHIPRDVHILGDVLKPIQIKLLNTEGNEKDKHDSDILEHVMDVDSEKSDGQEITRTIIKRRSHCRRRIKTLPLFRRRLKTRTFLDLEIVEKEKLASSLLKLDRFKDKSLFHYITVNKLTEPLELSQPSFIDIRPPPEIEYEDNFSLSPPSVHDLFDKQIEPLPKFYFGENDGDYEVMEYLEDEEV
ncbi:CLUMA_CG006480, isoform A [Clunio marinus]|uniref:CLUMA_CG006480, isoform A n=1 Tax=Clunio marinus TaxID=568069 RepID=A0A1J1I3W2_9DIPT|nr:CLUMA_CG006480, isoform A [Clunio marinus]